MYHHHYYHNLVLQEERGQAAWGSEPKKMCNGKIKIQIRLGKQSAKPVCWKESPPILPVEPRLFASLPIAMEGPAGGSNAGHVSRSPVQARSLGLGLGMVCIHQGSMHGWMVGTEGCTASRQGCNVLARTSKSPT